LINVHPAFDAKTQTWFWNEFEAPSLRELKRLLGNGVKIKDYYPMGLSNTIKRARSNKSSRLVTPTVALLSSRFCHRGYK
jgi:hypothetical protein